MERVGHGIIGTGFVADLHARNYGLPQELAHFCRCVLGKDRPLETGEDGRAVLEMIYAAYQSAGEGRKITWPSRPPAVGKPIDLWKSPGRQSDRTSR